MRLPLLVLTTIAIAAPALAVPPERSNASCSGLRSARDAQNQDRDDVARLFALVDPASLDNPGLYYQGDSPLGFPGPAHDHSDSYRACLSHTPPNPL